MKKRMLECLRCCVYQITIGVMRENLTLLYTLNLSGWVAVLKETLY